MHQILGKSHKSRKDFGRAIVFRMHQSGAMVGEWLSWETILRRIYKSLISNNKKSDFGVGFFAEIARKPGAGRAQEGLIR
jgi:hypothetical protein